MAGSNMPDIANSYPVNMKSKKVNEAQNELQKRTL